MFWRILTVTGIGIIVGALHAVGLFAILIAVAYYKWKHMNKQAAKEMAPEDLEEGGAGETEYNSDFSDSNSESASA